MQGCLHGASDCAGPDLVSARDNSGGGGKFPLALARLAGRGKAEASGHRAASLLRPQRPLQHAAGDARRGTVPSGLGLDSNGVRSALVQRLREWGITNQAVLRAIAEVPRHVFVDAALANQAYEDTSLPIGHGQTISKPSVVASMIELLFQGANARKQGHLGRVLEIGTGCGYQAALLANLSQRLISVERLRPLYDRAQERLAPWRGRAGLAETRLVYGDGRLGHAPNAPYDSIIAAAGGDALPAAWLEQLAVGGRLVAPVRHEPSAAQSLVSVDRTEAGYVHSRHDDVHFVPLKSGVD